MGKQQGRSRRLAAWVSVAIVVTVGLVGASIMTALLVESTYTQEAKRAEESLQQNCFVLHDYEGEFSGRRADRTDAAYLLENIPDLEQVALMTGEIFLPGLELEKIGGKEVYHAFRLISAEPAFFSIRGLKLAAGRFFDGADSSVQLAVVGADVAAKQGLRLGSVVKHKVLEARIKVIGILSRTEGYLWEWEARSESMQTYDINNTVFTPFAASRYEDCSRYYIGLLDSPEITERAHVLGQVKESASPLATAEQAENLLKQRLDVQFRIRPSAPIKLVHEYVTSRSRGSLWGITSLVILVGMINIAGLVMMHIFLRAKEIGIKRACGATSYHLICEHLRRYFWLSVYGACLALGLTAIIAPFVARYLGAVVHVSWWKVGLGLLLTLITGPVASMRPTSLAASLSPLSSIRDRAGWGLRRRKFDIRQALVAVAFGTAIGTVFFVSAYGLSTVMDIDRHLRAVGGDTLVITEPPLGSVQPIPHLELSDFAMLAASPVAEQGSFAWMPGGQAVLSKDGETFERCSVMAVAGDVLGTRGYSLAQGEWLSGRGQVVIGSKLARETFGGDPVGQVLLLGESKLPFTVVGVLKQRPNSLTDLDYDRDETALIAWEDRDGVLPDNSLHRRVYFQGESTAAAEAVLPEIKQLLAEGNPSGQNLVVENPVKELVQLRSLRFTFYLSVLLMSGLAVLTACAGIAALTLVQAREMQRSIAIRRACGATQNLILRAILTETLAIVLLTAALGLGVAELFYWRVISMTAMPPVNGTVAFITGLMIALIVSVAAAWFPAKATARRAPAELF